MISFKNLCSVLFAFLYAGIAGADEVSALDINQVKTMLQKEGIQSTFNYLVHASFLNTEDKAANVRTNEFLNHIEHGDKEWFSILTQFYKAGLIDGIYGEILSGEVGAALSTNPELVFSHWKAIGYEPECGHYPAEMGDPGPVDADTTEALKTLLPQRLAVSNVKRDEFQAMKKECLAQIDSSIKSMLDYAKKSGFQVEINGTNVIVRSK